MANSFTSVEKLDNEITRFSIAPKPVSTPSAPKVLKRTRSSVLDYDYHKTEMLKSQDALNSWIAANPPPMEFRRLFETFVNNYADIVTYRDVMYEAEKSESDRLRARCVSLCQDINELTMFNRDRIQENIMRNGVLSGKLQKTKDVLSEKQLALQNSLAREEELINQITQLRLDAITDRSTIYDLEEYSKDLAASLTASLTEYENRLLDREQRIKYYKEIYEQVIAAQNRNTQRLKVLNQLENTRSKLLNAMEDFVKQFEALYSTEVIKSYAGNRCIIEAHLGEIRNLRKISKQQMLMVNENRCKDCASLIVSDECDDPKCTRGFDEIPQAEIIDINETVISDEDEIANPSQNN